MQKTGIGFYKKNSEEMTEWEMYSKSLNRSVDSSQIIQLGKLNRYRLIVILDEIAEMSDEFKNTQKVTISYSFLGFEQKVVLNSRYVLKYGNVIPVQKVKLYYFFTNSVAGVHQLLKQKDVILLLV